MQRVAVLLGGCVLVVSSITSPFEVEAAPPEKLYREPGLMISVTVCTLAMALLLFVDIPGLHRVFAPTLPTVPSVSEPNK